MSTTVFGVIAANGVILSGSDNFTVLNPTAGIYSITFNTPFSTTPAVVASQGGNFPQPNSLDNAVVGILTAEAVTITTGDDDGNVTNRQFSFIATGN